MFFQLHLKLTNFYTSVEKLEYSLSKHLITFTNLQILNVYRTKYMYGGGFWPVVHNTTIFSLLLTQIIALGVFALKKSPISSIFTIILAMMTFLFNEYCRHSFGRVFSKLAAQVCSLRQAKDNMIIDMLLHYFLSF